MTTGPAGRPSPAADRWGDLTRRLGSAVFVALFGVALLLTAGVVMRAGVAALYGGLMWELARLTSGPSPWPSRTRVVALLSFSVLLLIELLPGHSGLALLAVPALVVARGARDDLRIPAIIFAVAMGVGSHGLIWLHDSGGVGAAVWIVAVVVVSDVLGYFVGRMVGGPKFWPALSPKKTWSGTIAGWIGATLLGLGLWATGWAGTMVIWLGPLLSFAGQMGDIAESWLKRRAGVKDSSDLIPGHGGLMDRFDAMTAAFLAILVTHLAGRLVGFGG